MRDAGREVCEAEGEERGPSVFLFVGHVGVDEDGCLRSGVEGAESFSFRFLNSKP